MKAYNYTFWQEYIFLKALWNTLNFFLKFSFIYFYFSFAHFYTTIQTFGVVRFLMFLCSQRLHLFDQNCNKTVALWKIDDLNEQFWMYFNINVFLWWLWILSIITPVPHHLSVTMHRMKGLCFAHWLTLFSHNAVFQSCALRLTSVDWTARCLWATRITRSLSPSAAHSRRTHPTSTSELWPTCSSWRWKYTLKLILGF